MWGVCLSILWASCTKHFLLVGWYLRVCAMATWGCLGEEQCSCTALCWRLSLRDCRACTSSKTFHLPVLNHVTSPGTKTFAIVGWPRRQQYLLVDSRQEVVQCPCRVWILYKGKSSLSSSKVPDSVGSSESPQPPAKWDLYVKLCKPFLSQGLDL